MIGTIKDIWRKRDIVGYFVSQELTSSYRTKAFGFLWALLDPFLLMAVYYLVFGKILASRPPSFMLHLFVGVIAFRFLTTASTQGASVLRSRSGLIREIQFPKAVLPIAIVGARLFDFAAGCIVAVPLAFLFGRQPNVHWLALPVVIIVQVIFVTGLALVTTYVGLFFADIENILRVCLRLWFYLTPILYPLDVVRKKAASYPSLFSIYMLNPMANLLEAYYAPIMNGRFPPLSYIAYASIFGIALLFLGLLIFSRAEGQVAKYV